jgi:hypothetical protein
MKRFSMPWVEFLIHDNDPVEEMKRILLYYIDSKKKFNVFPLKLIIKLTLILKHLDFIHYYKEQCTMVNN